MHEESHLNIDRATDERALRLHSKQGGALGLAPRELGVESHCQ